MSNREAIDEVQPHDFSIKPGVFNRAIRPFVARWPNSEIVSRRSKLRANVRAYATAVACKLNQRMSLFDDFERTDTSYPFYSETSNGYLNRSARLPEGRLRSVIDKMVF